MAEFPGAVFDPEGVSLIPGRPDLDQATIDVMPHRSIAARGLKVENDKIAIGRLWLLNAGATFDQVPAPERYAAHAMMREGYGVMILAPDPSTEIGILSALLDLLDNNQKEIIGHA